jgi:taurine dioxygenase
MSGTPKLVRRLTSSVGAVLEGYDLRRPLNAEDIREVRRALVEHGVIFFRGQELTEEQLLGFMACFGKPLPSAYAAPGEERFVTAGNLAPTRHSTAVWHADVTWLPAPPIFTALRAVRLPPVGGDTCWMSTEAGYDALSAPFRAMLDGLTAVHSMQPTLDRETSLVGNLDKSASGVISESIHPVVRVHPETGRKGLYVNECSTVRIVELGPAESAGVLGVLFAHIRSPEFTMRWHWELDDVVVWDNRNTQHFAVPDYTEERVLQRAEIAGEVPVGPHAAKEPALAGAA